MVGRTSTDVEAMVMAYFRLYMAFKEKKTFSVYWFFARSLRGSAGLREDRASG